MNASPRLRALLVAAAALAATPALAQKRTPLIPGGNSRAPINIDAGKLDYFDKESKLVYSGGVVARQGDATLKAPTLTILFNKEESGGKASMATLGGGDNQVKRMEADGPVTITSKDQVGTGDRGVYDRAENKVYLIGNPVLSEGPHIVRGDQSSRLIYDLDSGRAQVVGGRVQSIITPGAGQAGAGSGGRGKP
ncbi:MAG TPA: LptA/OstA family protein [Beijerinckiaceae bacterium]|jgi:lipopolysaccharide export system protein LptA